MTQSSCKHDTKSNSHPSVKLAPVRVFSCKHPLLSKISSLLEIWAEILAPFCSTDSTLNTPNSNYNRLARKIAITNLGGPVKIRI